MGFSKLFPVESFFDMSIFYLSRMTLDPNKTTFFLGVQKNLPKSLGNAGTRRHNAVSEFIPKRLWPRGFLKMIPSGKHTKSYWKWSFIVDFPIKKWWISIVMLNYQRVSLWEFSWAKINGYPNLWQFLAACGSNQWILGYLTYHRNGRWQPQTWRMIWLWINTF